MFQLEIPLVFIVLDYSLNNRNHRAFTRNRVSRGFFGRSNLHELARLGQLRGHEDNKVAGMVDGSRNHSFKREFHQVNT